MLLFVYLLTCTKINAESIIGTSLYQKSSRETLSNNTRRILGGHEVDDTRPYMVYLRPAPSAEAQIAETNWLCGGAIIHERYIITSAACIEDAKYFYVISGTHKWIPSDSSNDCITNGAKKAIWKCVPKSYVFDGNAFDNIQWMEHDIAVVKVDSEFNFQRRIRGCEFIPKKINFNNVSAELEKPGTVGSIAGWGSLDKFGDIAARTTTNSPVLLETDVRIISKRNCKKHWEQRYHYIIDEHMICGKDGTDSETMSAVCSEGEVNCKELLYSAEETEEDETRRMIVEPEHLMLHGAGHIDGTRRVKTESGGFCENDHGGPLVVGHGKSAIVVGVISACLTRELTKKCYGPFLYTSVWKNRHLVSCAIDKDIGTATCRRMLRSTKTHLSETSYNWPKHVDGTTKSGNIPISRSETGSVVKKSMHRMLQDEEKF